VARKNPSIRHDFDGIRYDASDHGTYRTHTWLPKRDRVSNHLQTVIPRSLSLPACLEDLEGLHRERLNDR
jgi:hypothetical protein